MCVACVITPQARTTNITWPPPHEDLEVPTACPLFYPPPSKVEAEIEKKAAKKRTQFESDYFADEDETMSFYSEEISFSGRRSATECVEILTETLDTQKLVDSVIKAAPQLNNNDISAIDLELVGKSISSKTLIENVDFSELKRPTEYTPNTVECKLSTKVENTVPQKWESPLVQAVRTTAPDPDTFPIIPSRKTAASPLASALAIAPAQPYNLSTHTTTKPVPLPDETEPYFPPEHPLILQEQKEETTKKEKLPPPKPYSPFVKALEIAPERPFTPVGSPAPLPPVKKKPKDPLDKLLEELPKPEEKLDMRSALTTASERPYTPLVAEFVDSSKRKESKTSNVDLIKPLKPEELPESFKMNVKAPKPPSYYPPSVLEKRIQSETQESLEASERKETKITETEVFEPAHVTHQVISLPQEPQTGQPSAYAPLFQGFTCSFSNKTDHSQFSIEVSTTPPVLSPPPKPQTPISYIATVEERPATIVREKVVEEKAAVQQHHVKQEKTSVEVRKEVHKQKEEVIQVKPVSVSAMLHKPEGLPSYQMDLKATAEADLILMERKQRAEMRIEEQKREREKLEQQQQQQLQQHQQQQQQQREQQQLHHQQHQQQQQVKVQKQAPIITVAPSENNHVDHQVNFKPVLDDRPSSGTFSPRPRPVTPSMINKAPPLLPYYQDNLVPHYQGTVETNLFDPTHPEISRTPSPHPENQTRSRSPSPFPGLNRHERAKSPAEGPPPNPLKSSEPLPNPQDSRVRVAKQNLQTYLPDYKNQRDKIEEHRGIDFCKKDVSFEEVADFNKVSQNVAYPVGAERQTGTVQQQVQQLLQVCDRDQRCSQVQQSGNILAKTDISEKLHQENFAGVNQVQSQNTTMSADGRTQVQRKKIVTEEFEHQHKEHNVQIERSITTTKPFSKVNVPNVEPPSTQTFHITNPHHLQPRLDTPTTLRQASEKLSETCRGQLQPAPTPPPMPPVRKVFPPNSLAPIKHVPTPAACPRPSANVTKPSIPQPNVGAGTGRQSGGITAAPKRGRGLLNTAALPGSRVALCGHCHGQIR